MNKLTIIMALSLLPGIAYAMQPMEKQLVGINNNTRIPLIAKISESAAGKVIFQKELAAGRTKTISIKPPVATLVLSVSETTAPETYSKPEQPSRKPAVTPLTPPAAFYEVNLVNGSQMPILMTLINKQGKIFFDGEFRGSNPQSPSPRYGMIKVSSQDFPLTLKTHDYMGMTGDFEFTFSLDDVRRKVAEDINFFKDNPRVTFGKENQFDITFSDARPQRTGMTHTRATVGAYKLPR